MGAGGAGAGGGIILKELVEHLEREWAVVSAAPFAFLIVIVLIAATAYRASRWKHSATIDLLRERLAAKDQQLDEYRERLHLVPARGSEFSRLSHAELQAEALKFVASLRQWLSVRNTQDSARSHRLSSAMASAKDEADRKRLWHEQTAELIASSEALNDEYAAKFKVTALVLRDELLTRVQRPDPTGRAHSKYDHPVNAITMGMVADDLELLARLLR